MPLKTFFYLYFFYFKVLLNLIYIVMNVSLFGIPFILIWGANLKDFHFIIPYKNYHVFFCAHTFRAVISLPNLWKM